MQHLRLPTRRRSGPFEARIHWRTKFVQVLEAGLAYPADRELDPADIRRISGGVGGRGGHRRKLQSVALKVLSQPISVGGVERVWSIFGWIQNKLRSKMLPATAKKLVMAHMWLKMAGR